MIKGDEWAGLIKVYQLLQKANCLMEDQYTVLKLESLLALNMLMDFSTLRLSNEAPYLMLVVCEATEQLKEETKDMIRKLFENVKKIPLIKVILTTRSEDGAAHFLQHIGWEIFGNGFVTRDEQLNWCDLTPSSQEKLLEESVTFQGADVCLNELLSAESAVAKFLPLGALVEEKELKIAAPLPFSNGYNESYYIRRTLRHQVAVKQEIYSDKDVRENRVFLATSEQVFEQYCQLYPNNNVHWFEKDNSGILVWQQSQGSLETLRRYIDTDSSHTYTDDDLNKLLEQAQHQRVMLIADTAGMGKSTVLTRLCKQIKQKFPTKWVVRIDLNDHTDALKELEREQIDKEKAIEFISEELLKLEPGLEVELFKQCCEQKQKLRIVIMVDGFDEVSPFYKDTVIDLLQALRQTVVEHVWVTTRPHLREELEDKLQQLCYTLEPFSEKDQVEFLKKFWSVKDWFTKTEEKGKEIDMNNLAVYAEHLIKKLAESLRDTEREFTGIPLQTCMLAEVFDKDVKLFYDSAESTPKLPFKLDLIELYGRFIERKYDIYQEKKFQDPVIKLAAIKKREHEIRQMRKDHQQLALKVLFTEEQVTLFQNNMETFFSNEELTQIGIVQVSDEGKPHFINRTFAEYFAADCLVNRLREENKTSEQLLDFILADVFLRAEYQVMRVFVDGLLSCTKPSNEVLKQCGSRIHDLGNDCVLILYRAVDECNVNIVKIVSDSLEAAEHTDTWVQMLLVKDDKEKTAWIMATERGNIELLEKLWECANEKLTTEEINKKLLLATDVDRRTVFHMATDRGRVEILQKLWEWANEKLTTVEIKNKLLLATDVERRTVFHMAADKDTLEILQKIWEWANEKLTTEEINKFLLATDVDRRTVFHMAKDWGRLEILQKLWEWANEKLTTEEIHNKLLLAIDVDRRTMFHMAAEKDTVEILQKLWEWANEKLTTEQINNKLLLATDVNRKTIFHMAINPGRVEILQKLWEWANEKLTTEEINNKLLLATDVGRRIIFHMAAYTDTEILQKLWEWANQKLTTEEINNELLLATDVEKKTVFHMAADGGRLEILQKFLEWAKEKLTTEEINNKLLLAPDKWGRTIFHLAAENNTLEILQESLEWANEKLTTEQINNKLLATDKRGMTVFHVATECVRLEILQKLWVWTKEKLTTEEINNKLLLARDFERRTVFHMAVFQVAADEDTLEIIQKLWEWANETLTAEEINNELLLATDKWGRTIFHVAAESNRREILQKLLEWAREKVTTEEVNNKLLLVTDGNRRTFFHTAAGKDTLEILQKLWEWANEKLTGEEIYYNLLLATDDWGMTVFHVATEEGKLEILQKLWEWAKEKLTAEEINYKLLLATDKWGRTIFHVATGRGRLEILQILWEWANENLTAEEINNKLLLATDADRITVFHLAADKDTLEILLKLWEWANEKLTTEEINKVLLATDRLGKTVFHWVTYHGRLQILQKLWEWAKEKLTREEINNNLLLATDFERKTVFHIATDWRRLEILQKLWEWANESLTTEEINNKLLLAADCGGRKVFHMATDQGRIEILKYGICLHRVK